MKPIRLVLPAEEWQNPAFRKHAQELAEETQTTVCLDTPDGPFEEFRYMEQGIVEVKVASNSL